MSVPIFRTDYISNESLKLDTYKRIAAIENKEEYEDMTEEPTDRFGEPPKNVQNLLAVAELKALAHCAYVTELKQMGDSVRVTLQQHAKSMWRGFRSCCRNTETN